jgi:DNA-binding PadR family transcriptional regulator
MRNLQERLKYAKVILHELSRKPLSRTMLNKRFIEKSGTSAVFEGIFKFLVKNGYIEKSGAAHRAPYRITKKGTKFLEGLS